MPIQYPPTLPPPTGITDNATERRRMRGRPGPWQVRPFVRERLGTVDIQWVLTAEEAQTWRTWFQGSADDGGIEAGGAWWAASWPSVRGGELPMAYQFVDEPRWEHAGRGIWRVAAQVQRRWSEGAALPGADEASSGGGGGGGGGSGGGGGAVPREEWHIIGSASSPGLGNDTGPGSDFEFIGGELVGPTYTRQVWDAVTSGTLSPTSTPVMFYLQRRTVTRGGPPAVNTIVADVLNLSTVPPALAWTPTVSDGPPIFQLWSAELAIWRLTSANPSTGIAFQPRGVLTIGGPGAGLRTVITLGPGFYTSIGWEYEWAAA